MVIKLTETARLCAVAIQAGSLLMLAAPGFAQKKETLLFEDDFSADSSDRYQVVAALEPGATEPNNRVRFAFDYSDQMTANNGSSHASKPIPPAPGSNDKKALYLEVNYSEKKTQGVNVYLPVEIPAGQAFAVEADVFFRVPGSPNGQFQGGSGSTQFYSVGINHERPMPQPPSVVSTYLNVYGDGYIWSATGDGGLANDYSLGRGSNPFALADVRWGDGENAYRGPSDDIRPGINGQDSMGPFLSIYPPEKFPYYGLQGGSCGDGWTRVRMAYDPESSTVRVFLDGQLAATYRDTLSLYKGGLISLSLHDTNSSVAKPENPCFLLFDNVKVFSLEAQG